MANLILTNKCQRKCAYCFSNSSDEFNMDNFKEACNFIATGPKIINLLGGEPTLNNNFLEMLEFLIINDFQIQVFTNGMLKGELIDDITNVISRNMLKEDQLYFAININEPKYRNEEEDKLQNNFMQMLNSISYISFTIQDSNIDLSFIREYIDKYSLDKNIRIGLALPCKSNKFLNPIHYEQIGRIISKFSIENSDIGIKLDCGFTMCMFNIEDVNIMNNNKMNDISFVCGSPIDIFPDLSISNCFPLQDIYNGKISDFNNISDLYKYLGEGLSAPIGIRGDKCTNCQFFRKLCFGGCKGFFNKF